jgi:hypothetical protein
MVIKKTKISTITPIVAIIAAIASMASIGGIGLGQQQTALAQPVDPRDIGEDEIDVGDIDDTVRDILEQVGVGDDESGPNCPPPLIHVRLPIDDPELFICVDPTFDVVPSLPDFP